MKVITLRCDNCGAPLEARRKANFVTCGFCEAQLAIHHTGSSFSTELLQDLQESTSALTKEVRQLRHEQTLVRLDQDWERERKKYMVRNKHGVESLPNKVTTIIGMVFGVLFMMFWIGMAGSAAPIMIVPGLLGVGFVIFGSMSALNKANDYDKAQKQYRNRRRELFNECRKSPKTAEEVGDLTIDT